MFKRVMYSLLTVIVCFILSFFSISLRADTSSDKVQSISLSSLNLAHMSTGYGTVQIDKSVQGKPLTIAGQTYPHGIGTHAFSVLYLDLNGQARRFKMQIGVDDETAGRGTITCKIYADEKKVYDSGVIKAHAKPVLIDLDLTGIKYMYLVITDGGDGIGFDHVDLINPVIEYTETPPTTLPSPLVSEEKFILTPKPSPKPSINGPRVYGARPGHPFLYRIPATGNRPMKFQALNLPASLSLDSQTGIITGSTPSQRGDYQVTFVAENKLGKDSRPFKIVVGDMLALTPPMGWNSWYIFYNNVTEDDMRNVADVMISSGMADFGYMYVNIDQSWQQERDKKPHRDPLGAILPNSKFPDIKGMVDYIHSKGLKAGLYSSPGPWTCGPYVGSYQHEEIDARKYAEWGFDFLKYDWCAYSEVCPNNSLAEMMKPYQKMGRILKQLDRDIVFNLCQYGMGDVWEWGGQVGGNCWRTTGDLGSPTGFYSIGLSNARHYKCAKPGQWNDPDYILIDDTITPNEQYSYMSMWCLMASPLIYSRDMNKLDDFTLNILCNAEVLDVDQDPLGRQARIVTLTEEILVLAKPMADGSLAVGLFNLDFLERNVKASWHDLGLNGPQRVRDLWRQLDEAKACNDQYQVTLPRHGVKLIRLFPKEKM